MAEAEYSMNLCVREYHVYQKVWEAVLGETLNCVRESRNSHDWYAVAVKKNKVIIVHLPRKVSRVCSLFLKRGGVIKCTVSGRCRYSADLPQEIPCLHFHCDKISFDKKILVFIFRWSKMHTKIFYQRKFPLRYNVRILFKQKIYNIIYIYYNYNYKGNPDNLSLS